MDQDGYSLAVSLEMVSGYSVQCSWSGLPSGSIFIEVSDESPMIGSVPTIWTAIPVSIQDITSNVFAGLTLLYKDALASYRWMRVGYAFNSGSGNLNIDFSAKGISP